MFTNVKRKRNILSMLSDVTRESTRQDSFFKLYNRSISTYYITSDSCSYASLLSVSFFSFLQWSIQLTNFIYIITWIKIRSIYVFLNFLLNNCYYDVLENEPCDETYDERTFSSLSLEKNREGSIRFFSYPTSIHSLFLWRRKISTSWIRR